ncbi:hypothetical protein G7046_g980 [Stylonectria norvegica]|nr:hypothetical protein G7046_g980 [Stylonectria norvegica]
MSSTGTGQGSVPGAPTSSKIKYLASSFQTGGQIDCTTAVSHGHDPSPMALMERIRDKVTRRSDWSDSHTQGGVPQVPGAAPVRQVHDQYRAPATSAVADAARLCASFGPSGVVARKAQGNGEEQGIVVMVLTGPMRGVDGDARYLCRLLQGSGLAHNGLLGLYREARPTFIRAGRLPACTVHSRSSHCTNTAQPIHRRCFSRLLASETASSLLCPLADRSKLWRNGDRIGHDDPFLWSLQKTHAALTHSATSEIHKFRRYFWGIPRELEISTFTHYQRSACLYHQRDRYVYASSTQTASRNRKIGLASTTTLTQSGKGGCRPFNGQSFKGEKRGATVPSDYGTTSSNRPTDEDHAVPAAHLIPRSFS